MSSANDTNRQPPAESLKDLGGYTCPLCGEATPPDRDMLESGYEPICLACELKRRKR